MRLRGRDDAALVMVPIIAKEGIETLRGDTLLRLK
jgi:hypothetical protein